MKTVIYGNQTDPMLLVERIIDSIPKVQVHVCYVEKDFTCIADYEEAKIDMVIFVGICPEAELNLALKFGMKVFVILAPVNITKFPSVFVSKARTLLDLPELEKELKAFINQTSLELPSKQVG